MKTPVITRFCFCFLLSTVSLAGAQVPTGTTGSTGTATAPRPEGSSASRAAVTPDYRLVTGDKLRIEVYKDAQLSQNLQIRPDGKITLPLLGDIPAAGRTSSELQAAIASSLKEYITNPVVTVIVVETVPKVIHVMGEVNTPGPQPVVGELSIIQALATAGGFKLFANKKDIQILRPSPTGVKKLSFNYNDAIKGEAKILSLQPGDTVIVK